MTEAACRGHSEVDMSGYNNDRLASMLETGIKERYCLEGRFRKLCREIVHLGEEARSTTLRSPNIERRKGDSALAEDCPSAVEPLRRPRSTVRQNKFEGAWSPSTLPYAEMPRTFFTKEQKKKHAAFREALDEAKKHLAGVREGGDFATGNEYNSGDSHLRRAKELQAWRSHLSVVDDSAKVSVCYEVVDQGRTDGGGENGTFSCPKPVATNNASRRGVSRPRRGRTTQRLCEQGRSRFLMESNACDRTWENGQERRPTQTQRVPQARHKSSNNTANRQHEASPKTSWDQSSTTAGHCKDDNTGLAMASPRRPRTISVEAKRGNGLEVRLKVGGGNSSESNSADDIRGALDNTNTLCNRPRDTSYQRVCSSSVGRPQTRSSSRLSEGRVVGGNSVGGEGAAEGNYTSDTLDPVEDSGQAYPWLKQGAQVQTVASRNAPTKDRSSRQQRRKATHGNTTSSESIDGHKQREEKQGLSSQWVGTTRDREGRCCRGRVQPRVGARRGWRNKEKVGQGMKQEERHGVLKDTYNDNRGQRYQQSIKNAVFQATDAEEKDDDEQRWRSRGRTLWSTHAEPIARAASAALRKPYRLQHSDVTANTTIRPRAQTVRPYHGLYARTVQANGIEPANFLSPRCCCRCECHCVVGTEKAVRVGCNPACVQIDDFLLQHGNRGGDHLAAERTRAPVNGLPDRMEAGRVLDSFNRRAELLGVTPPTPLRTKAAWMENPGDPEYRLLESSEGLLSSFCRSPSSTSAPLRAGRADRRFDKYALCAGRNRVEASPAVATTLLAAADAWSRPYGANIKSGVGAGTTETLFLRRRQAAVAETSLAPGSVPHRREERCFASGCGFARETRVKSSTDKGCSCQKAINNGSRRSRKRHDVSSSAPAIARCNTENSWRNGIPSVGGAARFAGCYAVDDRRR